MALLSKLWCGFWDLLFYERHIIVSIQVHARGRTVVKIDIEDPYQVKATSVLCLLGFGIGFGSVLLYRLYKRYYKQYTLTNEPSSAITRDDVTNASRKRSRRQKLTNGSLCTTTENLTEDTPDDATYHDDDDVSGDDISTAPSGDSGHLTDLSPLSNDGNARSNNNPVAMGNNVSRDDHNNTVHYDHYGNRVGFENYPWDPEGAPWNGEPGASSSQTTSSASVNIPRHRSRNPRTDDFTPGSAETYLEFLQNKFGSIPPSIANGIANGDIDVDRFLKSRDLDTVSGDISLMGNFSPTSLYEKNIHFSDTDSPENSIRRRLAHTHPLSDTPTESPELGRRSASPTVYRRNKEFDSPFKRSVRSADDLEEDEFEQEDLFTDESHVDSFFDKLEQELLSLKNEIADMDGTIEKLSIVPDTDRSNDVPDRPRDLPRDLGQVSHVLKKYSARSSRANSVTSDRPTPSDCRTMSAADERTSIPEPGTNVSATGTSTGTGTGTGKGNSSQYAPYHVHVHVHVHDEKKTLELPIRNMCGERDDEAMSMCSDSLPISNEPSPSRDDQEPIGSSTNDVANNNGDHQEIISSSASVEPGHVTVCNVGEVCDVISYAERECRGNTDTAKTMLKGYRAIPERLSYSRLRRIRSDQYCAIRSTLYQMFTNNVDISKSTGGLQEVTEILHDRLNHKHQYLRSWSFAKRLPVTSSDHVTTTMVECLQALYNQYNSLSGLNCTQRLETYCTSVNQSRDLDVKMMEGVKLLMMLNAIRLHEMCTQGKEVPLFVWLMYARDTSSNPRSLFRNHLDRVGRLQGLEQVELFLLADTLGIVLEVVRPSQYGEDDYITYFPSASDDLTRLTLIAEDDSHYNVLVP